MFESLYPYDCYQVCKNILYKLGIKSHVTSWQQHFLEFKPHLGIHSKLYNGL